MKINRCLATQRKHKHDAAMCHKLIYHNCAAVTTNTLNKNIMP